MKRLFLILLVLCTGQGLWAQTAANSALAFPSANNSFLGKTNTSTSVGVDLYTGMATVDIPICSLPAGSLTIPITLDYVDGRGVKVQEYATQVGLGWQLNAGGSITRVVRGFPDEGTNGYLGSGPGNGAQRWGQVINNDIATGTAFTASQLSALEGCSNSGSVPSCSSIPNADGEPDLFYVKTPFFSFQFVFDQNGNPVVSNYNGYQVIANNFVGSSYAPNVQNFEVVDDKGNQYYFGTGPNTQETSTDTLYNQPYTFTSTWYLYQIISYNHSDNVSFSYVSAPGNDVTYSYSWSEIENTLIQTQTTFVTGQNIIAAPKYVSSIASAEGSVQFNYTYNRLDDPNVPSLSSIVASAVGPLQTYNFNYSYFGLPSTDPNVLRLELTGVTMAGNTSQTATPITVAGFGYNTAYPLANRTTQVFDFWGYNLTQPSTPPTDLFEIGRTPDPNATQAALLNSVTTLLGGTYHISYQGNTFGLSGSTPVGGVRVDSITQTLPTGEHLYSTYQYEDGNGNSYGEILNPYYNLLSFYFGTSTQGSILYLSGSPYLMADVYGNFVGYSTVKKTAQNGGYALYNFTNFNDPGFGDASILQSGTGDSGFPMVFSTTSVAFKRGQLKSMYVYNAANTLLSQTINTYDSLNTAITKEAWGLKPFSIGAELNSLGGSSFLCWVYYTPYENYRLIQSVTTDYDQLHPTNSVQTTTNYGYDANNWLVDTVTTTDAKGKQYRKQFYHAADAGIPFLSSSDQTAITDMLASNRKNVLIHEVDTRNGVVSQVHNSFTAEAVTSMTNVFQTGVTTYAGSTLEKTETLVSDPITGNLITSGMTGGKSTAIQYGYGNEYPVAKVVNATSSIVASTNNYTASGTIYTTTSGGSATFTSSQTGSVVLTLTPQLAQTYTVEYLLTATGYSMGGSLCNTRGGPTTCSYASTVTIPNVPAGNYTLTITPAGGTPSNTETGSVAYTYPTSSIVETPTNEFFYEGFEANTSAISGSAHTGNMYWDAGAYSVPFTPPNNRAYTIQWWSWNDAKWVMNQRNYTTGMSLSAPIDDVRVFPTDGLMTTYTYNPLVGKTSETDPSGRATTYQYDGFGRLNLVLDDDGNILQKYCYSYAGQPLACTAGTIYTSAAESGSFTPTSCPTGSSPSGPVTYTVAAGAYTSTISQADANQQALNDVAENGLAYANAHATCITTYYNVADSGSFTRNNCAAGYAGSTVIYRVAAGTYSSTTSQAAANLLAANDVAANGQNYANANGTCTTTAVLTTRDLSLTGNTASVTFTTAIPQTITLTEDNNPGASYSLVYTISGAKAETGYTCISHTTTKCSYPLTISFASMPAGTYTLTIQLMSGSSSLKGMTYSYYAIP